jgi:HD-GYP domain-containing protein (c-di-GMP phosphodiesterase class II)
MLSPIDVVKKPDRPPSEPLQFPASEIISGLTLALDLSKGQPMGHSVRSCVLGMRLAHEILLPQGELSGLYYALLMKDAGYSLTSSSLRVKTRCEQGAVIAGRMGLPDATGSAIRSVDERWNGEGKPNGWRGEEIPLLARIVSLAQTLEMFYTAEGAAAALDAARARIGSWFDPELVRAAESLAARGGLWTGLDDASRRVVELEPAAKPLDSSEATLDTICQAFGEVIDAKTPLAYHSAGVAETTVFIARTLGLAESGVRMLRRAALLHDIGKLGVPDAILDKPGKLTGEEWVVLRKHVFYSYAILKRVPGFGELSEVAGSHHEKLDGSGYFRGLKGAQISLPTRILVVADIFDALSTKRPYRDALPPELAFQIMRKQAPHSLDANCLEALIASYHSETSNASGLAQLSANLLHS